MLGDKNNISFDNLSEQEIIKKAKEGNEKAKELLIKSNLKLIRGIALNIGFSNIYLDELIEYGILGLLNAIKYYDFKKNVSFSTYVKFWIRKEMFIFLKNISEPVVLPTNLYKPLYILKRLESEYIDKFGYTPSNEELYREYNKQNNIVYISLNQLVGLRHFFKPCSSLNIIEEHINSDSGEIIYYETINSIKDSNSDFSESSINKINYEKIKHILNGNILSNLTEKERIVLCYRFGFNETNNQMSLSEIAKILNSTKQAIYNLEQRGLRKIKQKLLEENIITKNEILLHLK